MGKFSKDSYASTYAARNVKEALDRLIDVLQSPAQVRKLVIESGTCTTTTAAGSRKPGAVKLQQQGMTTSKLSLLQDSSSASTAPVSASMVDTTKKKQSRAMVDAPSHGSSCNSSEKKKVTTSTATATATVTTAATCSGSSQTSECCNSSSDHIPVGRFNQLQKKSLQDYPSRRSCGNIYNSKERQRSSTPQLATNWSSVPCKSGDFEFGC